MNAINHFAPTISEPLSWAAICERYPEQWVCLVEVEFIHPNAFEFRTARVVGHGKISGEALTQAHPWRERYRCIAHYSTRPIPRWDPMEPAPEISVDEWHPHDTQPVDDRCDACGRLFDGPITYTTEGGGHL